MPVMGPEAEREAGKGDGSLEERTGLSKANELCPSPGRAPTSATMCGALGALPATLCP